MKAVIQDRYGGPEHLRLVDIPVPQPEKAQIRIEVSACAVNLSDWEYLIGSPFYARLIGGLTQPRHAVLGSDVVGIVDKIGPDVAGFDCLGVQYPRLRRDPQSGRPRLCPDPQRQTGPAVH